MKPHYFYQTSLDNTEPQMLYTVYADDQIFYANNGNWFSANFGTKVLEYCQNQPHFHPCSLADVRAAFDNISAHKRINTSAPAGTNPA